MINRFEGKYFFLSNFSNSKFCYEGINYPTVEHYFQAQKTLDSKERERIAKLPTPGEAKYAGRRVELRKDWEEVKDSVMLIGLYHKFKDPVLREKLLATGNEHLEEGNYWHDTYWGVCDGVGKNRLGELLMTVRKEVQNGWYDNPLD